MSVAEKSIILIVVGRPPKVTKACCIAATHSLVQYTAL